MFTPLSTEHVSEARLVPAATVSVPLTYFEPFGIRFVRDEDDLDAFEFAGLSIRNEVFGLIQYDHAPDKSITVLLPEGMEVARGLSMLAGEFALHMDQFHWNTVTRERATELN